MFYNLDILSPNINLMAHDNAVFGFILLRDIALELAIKKWSIDSLATPIKSHR